METNEELLSVDEEMQALIQTMTEDDKEELKRVQEILDSLSETNLVKSHIYSTGIPNAHTQADQ